MEVLGLYSFANKLQSQILSRKNLRKTLSHRSFTNNGDEIDPVADHIKHFFLFFGVKLGHFTIYTFFL